MTLEQVLNVDIMLMRKLFVTILIIIVLTLYIISVISNSTITYEVWILERIFIQSLLTITVLVPLAFAMTNTNIIASSIIYSILVSSLIVLVPSIKYPNEVGIFDPFDSLAHYSFSKWIAQFGHVPSSDIYYAVYYSHHPGNGLIPAFLSIVSLIPLGSCINILLLGHYITYLLLFHAIISKCIENTNNNVLLGGSKRICGHSVCHAFLQYLSLIAAVTVMYLQPFYTSVSFTTSFIALMIYCLLVRVFISGNFNRAEIITIITGFVGLLLTSPSASTLMVVFFFLSLILARATAMLKTYTRGLKYLAVTTLSVFAAYALLEVYIDTILFKNALSSALKTLLTVYIREVYLATKTSGTYSLALSDYILLLVALHTKIFIILLVCIIQLLIFVIDKATSRKIHIHPFNNIMYAFQGLAMLLWPVYWIITGRIISIVRVIPLLQLFASVNLLSLLTVLLKKVVKRGDNAMKMRPLEVYTYYALFITLSLVIIMVDVISNWSLGIIGPVLTYRGEKFKLASNGVVSPVVLHAYTFVERYVQSLDIVFTCINGYTTFGYCDLLWGVKKIPLHCDTPRGLIKSLRLVSEQVSAIVPVAISHVVPPSKYTTNSFISEVLNYLLAYANAIYNNKYYDLYIIYHIYKK